MTPGGISSRKSILQTALVVGLLLIVFLLIRGLVEAAGAGEDAHKVTYRVDGSTTMAVVTYRLPDGSSTKPEDVSLPWKKTVTFTDSEIVVLTASNPVQTGVIRCQILLDGEVWKQEQAKSAEDKVSCAGILP